MFILSHHKATGEIEAVGRYLTKKAAIHKAHWLGASLTPLHPGAGLYSWGDRRGGFYHLTAENPC